MANSALLEYYTASPTTLLFVAKGEWPRPKVCELMAGDDQPLTGDHLTLCAERLLIDFHGLRPVDWVHTPAAARYRAALALPPAVHENQRVREVNRITLAKPKFLYRLDYWEALSRVLLPPAVRAAIADCELLCIVPHGPLHKLPFAALRWSDDEYLVERFGICQVPSATVLRYCQAKNKARARIGHRPTTFMVAAVKAGDEGKPGDELEAGGEEIAAVMSRSSGRGRVTVLRGQAPNSYPPASKPQVLAAIGGHDVIHFACHGLFGLDLDGAGALDSGLLLSDGASVPPLQGPAGIGKLTPARRTPHLLTAREILGLSLQADLVTLHACSSARVDVRIGDELTGLIRAFLYAGTPSVIASLWNVDKESSQRLLKAFYEALLSTGRRVPKWRALQTAQLGLLRGTDPHPYHWAAFVLVGDWL